MEDQKSRKEVLLEEINELTRQIENARKSRKSSTKLRSLLVELVVELDSLGKDEET